MRPWPQPVTRVLVFVAILLFAGLAFSIVAVPPLLVAGNGLSGVDLAKAENDARGTLVAGWTGLAVAVAGVAALLTYRLSRRGQVTDRFSRAIDQLGATSMAVRTGGLYALEQIISDSPELQWAVMETLFAYLSQNAPRSRVDKGAASYPYPATDKQLETLVKPLSMATDVQAALTIIGRRNPSLDKKEGVLSLKNLNLSDARLRGANLQSADKHEKARTANAGPQLGSTIKSSKVQLSKVNIRHTHLAGAHIEGALLANADFTDAVLIGAHLKGADLTGADFEGMRHAIG